MKDGTTFGSLIEGTISKLAQDESGKRQHYRPVYSLHKWWARRSGAQFRSIILLAAGITKGLFQVDANGSLLESSRYFRPPKLDNLIVFDPFMGGGTTLVEANRLGAKVIGCDVNPVSYWIVRESLRSINLEQLASLFADLDGTVGERIRKMYQTDCAECGSEDCDGLYVFWIREAICQECNERVPLYKRTLLNRGLQRNKPISKDNTASVFCPSCFGLNAWEGTGFCTCENCGVDFDPRKGTFDYGKFCCPSCGKEGQRLAEISGNPQLMDEKIVAIEYWCSKCKKRIYKTPDSKDDLRVKDIWNKFSRMKENLIIPRQMIPEGSSARRWRAHGYDYYFQIFNPRQLLAINFVREKLEGVAKEYRDAFVTILSNSLEYNNMMTPYNYPHRKLHHLFTYHALPLTTTPVENSFWGFSRKGAGTFVNCYERYYKAKYYGQSPFDRYKDSEGRIRTIFSQKEKVEGNLVTNFEHLSRVDRGAMLFCRDSSHIPEIPNNSVDLVITDPPYFDNVHYSELSNFFYVWLRLLVQNEHFEKENVSAEGEAVVNSRAGKDQEAYQRIMASVFTECRRVLKDRGTLAFTFHHTKLEAWWTILCAIKESGFSISASFPVSSEYKVSPHIRMKDALDMDLVLFCKRKQEDEISSGNIANQLKAAMTTALERRNIQHGNEILLRFIGDILRIASKEQVQYNWLSDSVKQLGRELDTNFPSNSGIPSGY